MSLIEKATYYIDVIGFVLIAVIVCMAGLLYYLIKIRKIAAKNEKIDYSSFRRKDALEYVKFENVVSESGNGLSGAGMICLGNNVFVGGISVRGYNFSSASAEEKVNTMIKAVMFCNLIEEPVQMRQSVKAIDLTTNISEHEEIVKKLALELMELDEQYRETLASAEDYLDEPEVYYTYEKHLRKLQKDIYAKRHMMDEAHALIQYMSAMVGDTAKKEKRDAQKINQILFSYSYDPNSVSEELTKEEIYLKAFGELEIKARSYSSALSGCGCVCRRLSAGELIGLMRRHCAPATADDVKLDELFNSSYSALFISSDSLIELEKQRIGEEQYQKEMARYMERMSDILKQHEMNIMRDERLLRQEVFEEAGLQMKAEVQNG